MLVSMKRFSLRVTALFLVAQYLCFCVTFARSKNLRLLSSELTYIHFIGDLHGDEKCAKAWVERTNLVNLTSTPYSWIGNMKTDAIVFLGDYVDKGSTSRAVMEFVRKLQETFPDNVVAMLGNHDNILLYDVALSPLNPDASKFPSYESTRSNIHPEEYIRSGWSPHRNDDEDILVAIHKALQLVYAGEQRNVYACVPPLSKCKSYHLDLFTDFPPFNSDLFLADRARHRIAQWREEYANGMAQSGLLKWLGSRPAVAIIADALVVHGGISPLVMQSALDHSENNNVTISIALNEVANKKFHRFWEHHAPQMQEIGNAIIEPLPNYDVFEVIDDLVEYRGYFDDDKSVGLQQCNEVNQVLRHFEEVNRIVVGHTPHYKTIERCNGRLLATDSYLSRFFRSHHGFYCPHGDNLRRRLTEENLLTPTCEYEVISKCRGTTSFLSRISPSDPWQTNTDHIEYPEE